MKIFLRNFIIILICNLSSLAIVSSDNISDSWKLQIMFLGGIISGAVIAGIDAAVYDKKTLM